MGKFQLSTATWKWLICLLSLAAALLLFAEARHGFHAIATIRQQGSLGAQLNGNTGLYPASHGSQALQILALDPGSPLLAYGALPGDRLQFDRPLDRWRHFGVGDTVGLTLVQQHSARHLLLQAAPAAIPFAEQADYLGRLLMAGPALLISFLIGLRRAGSRAQRPLALAFCALSMVLFGAQGFSPAGPLFEAAKLLQLASYPLIWAWFAAFALQYQAGQRSGLRRALAALLPCYTLLACGVAAYALWFGLGHDAPLLLALTVAAILAGSALTLLGLASSYRASCGELRQRHRWLLLSFALGTVPAVIVWIPTFSAGIDGMRWTLMLRVAGQLLMYAGLAYTVLRHRVGHFGFALSRFAVAGVLGAILLAAFAAAEHITWTLLGAGGETPSAGAALLIHATIALCVYLAFHHLHARVEGRAQRLLFRRWHESEHRLRRFVRHAAHIASGDALAAAFQVAVDRFTGQAGCAVYMRQHDGSYYLAPGATLAGAPPLVDADNSLPAALRAAMQPQDFDGDRAGMPGQLAVPVSHRSSLNGFVVVGAKRGGDNYRPDESALLAFAAHEIGLDLHAIRVRQLEEEVIQLNEGAGEAQAGERRKMPRQFAGAMH